MYPILLKIGPITVYTYGALVSCGIIVGLFFALRAAKRENINTNNIFDISLYLLICGFIGARIFYVFTEIEYFFKNPQRIFFANEGFVFFGGFIGAFLISLWYVKKHKLPTWKIADIFAPSAAIAHSIGRLGCFFYGCCYGRPTNSFIGVLFPPESPAGALHTAVIPTQLISSLVLVFIFCILIITAKYKRFDGQVFCLYVLLYSIARFIIEFFRGDPRGEIWIFSTSQFIAIFAVITAGIAINRLGKRVNVRKPV